MSERIQTAFPENEAMPSNIFPDLNWIADNRINLYKEYGDCVIVVYKEECRIALSLLRG